MRLSDEQLYLDYCKEMEIEPIKDMLDVMTNYIIMLRKLEPNLNSGIDVCSFIDRLNSSEFDPDPDDEEEPE